jgi:hypothetical protein
VRVTLRAKANNRAGFIEKRAEIDIFIGKDFREHKTGGSAADGSGAVRSVNPASRVVRLIRERSILARKIF